MHQLIHTTSTTTQDLRPVQRVKVSPTTTCPLTVRCISGVGQLDINNLFLFARAGSLGRSRRRFSLNGSLYLGRSLGGLGSLGGFLRFLAGSWFLCRFILLAGSLFLSGRSSFFLVCLGWTAPAFRGLGVFLLLGNLCGFFGLGRGRARARPCCVSYDFCFKVLNPGQMITLPEGYYNGNRIMANSRYGNRKSDKL